MKSRILGTLLLTLTFFSFGYSQCSISNLDLSNITCLDNGNFTVDLNFSFDEVGDQGFMVQGNGTVYGTYSYADLPVTIENTANCFTQYEFVVRDVASPNCNEDIELGQICCNEDCVMEISSFQSSDCVDGMNDITVEFDLQYYYEDDILVTTDNGFQEVVPLQGNSITLNDFVSGNNPVINFTFASADSTCMDTYVYENNCVCSISNLDAQVVDCNEDEMTYFVEFNFDHNMTSDSFLIGGNSVFGGTFSYNDLPIVLGPYDFSPTLSVNFLIQDQGSFFCFDGLEMGVINSCDLACDIEVTSLSSSTCNSGTKNIEFSIASVYEGEQGFNVELGGTTYGPFAYGQSNYILDNVPSMCQDFITMTLSDVENEGCITIYEITEDLCCECALDDLTVNVNCESDVLTYDFEYNNTSERYFLRIFKEDNVEYQEHYDYGQLDEINIANWTPGTYKMVIVDNDMDGCMVMETFNIDCGEDAPCVENMVAEVVSCENGEFNVVIEFDYSGAGGTFEIRGNGNTYGTYTFGESNYVIEGLAADCETIYEFVVVDPTSPDCTDFVDFEGPVCCEGNECFDDFSINYLGCDENGNASIVLDFESGETSDDNFEVRIDGETETYPFSDLPLTLTFDGGVHDFRLSYGDCVREFQENFECQDCEIGNIDFEIVDCNEESALINLFGDFFLGSEFSVFLNGSLEGTYETQDTIPMDNVDYNETNTITFTSIEYPACSIEYMLDPFICPSSVVEDELGIQLYKNGNYLIFEGDALQKYAVTIIAINGSVIETVKNSPRSIEVNNYVSGIYLVRIKTDQKSYFDKVWID